MGPRFKSDGIALESEQPWFFYEGRAQFSSYKTVSRAGVF